MAELWGNAVATIAALAQVGTTWLPVGDWASMAYRTSRVGTTDTPLIGAYTVKGWALPGPLLYWLAAPLFRLTDGDARALEWTAAILNAATTGTRTSRCCRSSSPCCWCGTPCSGAGGPSRVDMRIAVFEGPEVCADDVSLTPADD